MKHVKMLTKTPAAAQTNIESLLDTLVSLFEFFVNFQRAKPFGTWPGGGPNEEGDDNGGGTL